MTTQLAKKEDQALAAKQQAEIDAMFGESAIEEQMDVHFPVCKILRESAQFQIGDDNPVKTMTGHIIYKHRANQWWEVPFDERTEEDSPLPNCFSVNGDTPTGGNNVQAEQCATCKLNQFKSAKDSNGKACRNTIRFLFLPDCAVLPIVIAAPPTSISRKGYVQQWLNSVPNTVATVYGKAGIKGKGGRDVVDYWPIHVELSTEKTKCGNGMEASILKIKTLDVICPDGNDGTVRSLQRLHAIRTDGIEVYKAELETYIQHEDTGEADAPADEPADDDNIPI